MNDETSNAYSALDGDCEVSSVDTTLLAVGVPGAIEIIRREATFMCRTLCCFALFIAALTCSAETLDLIGAPGLWAGGPDRPGPTLAIKATPEAPLVGDLKGNGGDEDYPKLRRMWSEPQDWSRFMRLNGKIRVVCNDPSVTQKRMALVFYDDAFRHADMDGHPMVQQCINHYAPVNEWIEFRDWMVDIHRTRITQLDLYVYEEPTETAHEYRWEFARLDLEGVGETAALFDTEIYARGELQAPPGKGPGQHEVRCEGLTLGLGDGGEILSLVGAGGTLGGHNGQPTGLLVRDANKTAAPVMVGGEVTAADGQVRQSATVESLGVAIEATYRTVGGHIEVSGKVRDLRGEDRAVTVYLALPLAEGEWRWWDSAAQMRPAVGETEEFSNVERNRQWGLNGMHSKYPIGAVSLPDVGGLTLGVRMDEPVVHRIACNPLLRLMYIALDFGLAAETTQKGVSLSEAPFRVLVYPHDPAWGFRSALQRYYDAFPEFFTYRTEPSREGGWYVWGDMRTMERVLEGGFGFHWGPGSGDAVKWDNDQGVYPVLYIEPEFFQLTMGDWDRRPTGPEGLDRLNKMVAGDEEELAKFQKLGYAHSYTPGVWVREHSFREATLNIAQAASSAAIFGRDGKPAVSSGQYPWMTESQWGIIFPCNLDPDIPGGKGPFCLDVYIASGLRESGDGAYDGIGLDSFGGYGQDSRANFRREHFRYTDVPLSFSASPPHVPVIVAAFSSVEWVKELAARMHAEGKILMTNCSWGTTPAWLTFAAPYLDVFGAEAVKFADPDFVRAIARRKACTDLPYSPRPDWEIPWHLLHGIYPGHGNTVDQMAPYADTLRDLAAAGWEPITHARSSAPGLQVERFGAGQRVFLSVHNPAEGTTPTTLSVDAQALGMADFTARLYPDGAELEVAGGAVRLLLEGQDTQVVELRGK